MLKWLAACSVDAFQCAENLINHARNSLDRELSFSIDPMRGNRSAIIELPVGHSLLAPAGQTDIWGLDELGAFAFHDKGRILGTWSATSGFVGLQNLNFVRVL
mgnify:CR=1 FL=1